MLDIMLSVMLVVEDAVATLDVVTMADTPAVDLADIVLAVGRPNCVLVDDDTPAAADVMTVDVPLDVLDVKRVLGALVDDTVGQTTVVEQSHFAGHVDVFVSEKQFEDNSHELKDSALSGCNEPVNKLLCRSNVLSALSIAISDGSGPASEL